MFKKIIISLYHIHINKIESYQKISGLKVLLDDCKRNSIEFDQILLDYKKAVDCSSDIDFNEIVKEAKNQILDVIIKTSSLSECLVISDLSCIILAAKKLKIPSIGYDNSEIAKQDLFQANMLVEGFLEVNYRFVLEVYQRFYQIPIIIARTNRILIREMILEDLDELFALYEDSSITRYLEPLYEKNEEISYARAYIKNMYGFYGYGVWSLIDISTGRLVGRAGLSNREIDGEIQIELGYMIGVPYQRQGIAFEVCLEILKFAVRKLNCFFVNCFIHSDNIASIGLVEKLGFVYLQEIDIDSETLAWYRWTYEGGEGIINETQEKGFGRNRLS